MATGETAQSMRSINVKHRRVFFSPRIDNIRLGVAIVVAQPMPPSIVRKIDSERFVYLIARICWIIQRGKNLIALRFLPPNWMQKGKRWIETTKKARSSSYLFIAETLKCFTKIDFPRLVFFSLFSSVVSMRFLQVVQIVIYRECIFQYISRYIRY